jgi:hypothetical protein
MRYKVTLLNVENSAPVLFDYIQDFQNEFIGDEYYINLLNEIYDEIDLPYVGKVPAGDALRAFYQQNEKELEWDCLVEDLAAQEEDYILDELEQYGEMYYDNYKIVDMNFEAEEE